MYYLHYAKFTRDKSEKAIYFWNIPFCQPNGLRIIILELSSISFEREDQQR